MLKFSEIGCDSDTSRDYLEARCLYKHTEYKSVSRDGQTRLWRMWSHNSHTEKYHTSQYYAKFYSF